MSTSPFIVGLGGALTRDSASERVLRHALAYCETGGATTAAFCGTQLAFPHYDPKVRERGAPEQAYVEALQAADGVIICTPCYHGTVSGLVKNALDYVEDLSRASRPYLTDRPVALIAIAAGWQASTLTLMTLRSVVHALRGWPTPLAVSINSIVQTVGPAGEILDPGAEGQLRLMADQLLQFSLNKALQPPAPATGLDLNSKRVS